MDARNRYGLIFFLVLTFAISSIHYVRSFSGASLGSVVPFLMWTPGLCAIVTQLVFRRTIAGLGWRLGPWRYLGLAMLLPVVYGLAIYVPVWVVGGGRFDAGFLATVFPILPLALAQNLVFALGEEIAWRGFLVPALYRAGGFAWSGIASGIIWGLWHVPLIAVGGYGAGTPAWYAVTCFMIAVTAMSVTLAWLRLRSASIWPAVLYHGVHNLAIQRIFDGSTIDTGWTKWITTEFGIGLTIASVAMSVYFWRRRGELTTPASAVAAPTSRR
jgi:membrane protease YdiL (CAAX protease family)